jgi:copper(I)-binding protein
MSTMRLRAVAGLAALLTLAGCGAGQNTQTDSVEPAVNGNRGQVGAIMISDAQFAYPSTGTYPAGGAGPLILTIVNTGSQDDELVDVSTPIAESVEVTGDRSLIARRALQVGTPGESVSGRASTSSTPSTAATTTSTTSTTTTTGPSTPSSGAPGSGTPSSGASSSTATSTSTPVELGKATIVVKQFTEALRVGKTYPVTFVFRNAGSVTINLPIAAPSTPRPEPTGESHS